MAENETKKEQIIRKLKDKYKLVVYNEETYSEVFHFRLSRLNVFAYAGFSFLFITIIVILMLIFTPLGNFLPDRPNNKLFREVLANTSRIDSLDKEIEIRDNYLESIQRALTGKIPKENSLDSVSIIDKKNLSFEKSSEDSMIRQQVAEDERYSLTIEEENVQKNDINKLHFFAPISKGMITNGFDLEGNHFAVDIVASPDEVIMATLDGTVIEAAWTLLTGYVIQVQHDNNLISIYKHNSVLLKEVGDRVRAGETIAIIGNTGELSTGPHLHFELWHKGTPLDPENYIVF